MLLFTPSQTDFALHIAFGKVQIEWYEGITLLLNLTDQFADLNGI
jgi:hypothetical protein